MFKRIFYFKLIIVISLSGCNDGYTEIDQIDLKVKLPLNYTTMNRVQFEEFFKNKYDEDVLEERLGKLLSIEQAPKYAYIQDTTNIYNNIVMFEIPFIKLKKKNSGKIQSECRKLVQNGLPEYNVDIVKTRLTRGSYPYLKIVFKIWDSDTEMLSTYYFINKVYKSKLIIVNNFEGVNFENMVKLME